MITPDGRVPKAEWPAGPWTDEPDHVEFRHEGLPCILHRSPASGAWCGYVGVPPGHPWHGLGYDYVDADAHGGLTYADACRGPVCHVPAPGEPDDVWWLGFDCAHAGDFAPMLSALVAAVGRPRRPYVHEKALAFEAANPRSIAVDVYRDVAYVRRETEALAEQAAGVARGD